VEGNPEAPAWDSLGIGDVQARFVGAVLVVVSFCVPRCGGQVRS